MYAPNVGAPQYVRQMLTSMKGEINNNTLIVGDFGKGNGTPLQYSCLENPMDGGAWWAADHGVAKSWTWLSTHTYTHRHTHRTEIQQ